MTRKGILGVDVGGTNIKAALVFGRKIERRTKILSLAHAGIRRSIEQLKSVIEPFRKEVCCIGIGIAGIIDSKNGVVIFSPNLKGWNNVSLAKYLHSEFNVPIRLLNDVNAICLGEWKYGVAQGCDNVFLFTLGTGVGGAAICEGRLLFGANGFAGEFGHTTVNPKGPKCICGHYGHLERYVGAKYIVARAKKKMKRHKSSLARQDVLTPEIIALEARQGDTVARQTFAEVGYYIGVGVANILSLFDPDIVVISGGIARAGKVLFEPVRETVRRLVLGAEHRRYKIVPARLGDDAGILGAALFAQSRGKPTERS
jgi:glucokinase